MADNTTLNSGTGGDVIRDIDRAGVKTQVTALDIGGAASELLWSATNPAPVTVGNFPATQPISGTVSVSGTVPVSGTFYQTTQPVSIATMPSTPVTGTFWQTTQPVSLASLPALATGANTIGAISNTSFAATQSGTWNVGVTGSVGVTGTFWQATQPVSGTFWQTTQPVSIASMPSTPVTGTFWQATQPVSGTVTTTGAAASGATLSGNPVLIAGSDGTNARTIQTDTTGRLEVTIQESAAATTGSITSAASTVIAALNGCNSAAILVGDAANTAFAGVNFAVDLSYDSQTTWVQASTFFPIAGGNWVQASGVLANSAANKAWTVPAVGATHVKVRATAWTSGTANVRIQPASFPAMPPATAVPTQVGGPGASGAALTGNPNRIGGAFNTTQPTVTTGQTVDLQATARGELLVTLSNGAAALLPAAAASADALANPTVTQIGAAELWFNGTTWDRVRNNVNGTTGDTGAKTASFAGATQTNYNAKGAIVTVLCGTVSGTTPTLTAQLQYSPDAGTTWVSIGAASTAVTATGNTIVFLAYPTQTSVTTGGTQTVLLNTILPRTWRLNYVIGGTTPSFAITAVYVNYVN